MFFQKICIFRTGALGDVILTLPVIQNLQRTFPQAKIHLIGNPRLLALAQTDTIYIHDINRAYWATLFAPQAHLSETLTSFFQNTDLVISYLPDSDHVVTQNLHRLGVTQIITHPAKPQTNLHAVDHLLSPLDTLNIPTPETHPKVHLSQNDPKDLPAHNIQTPTLLIHPGSGGKNKCLPPEHFAQIADTLIRQKNCQVILSSGPADGELAQRVADLMHEKAIILPELPICQFGAFMTTCTVYLGNDSGPSHLAAAVGLPTVALFGPTDPQIWAPRGQSVYIIQSPNHTMASISPNKVIETIHPLLPSY